MLLEVLDYSCNFVLARCMKEALKRDIISISSERGLYAV